METKDHAHHQHVNEQLIKKERELIELQDRLMEEVALKQQMRYSVINKDKVIRQLQQQLPPRLPVARIRSSLRHASPDVGSVHDDSPSCRGFRDEDDDDASRSILSVATPQSSYRTGRLHGPPGSFGPSIPLGVQPMDQRGREPLVGPAYSRKHCTGNGGPTSTGQGSVAIVSPWAVGPNKKPPRSIRRSNYILQGSSTVLEIPKSPVHTSTFNCPSSPQCVAPRGASPPISFMSSKSSDGFGSPVQHQLQYAPSEGKLLGEKKERRLILGSSTFA